MNRVGSTLLLLACGTLGAALSLLLVLMIPADGAANGYRELITNELPVLVFAVGMGFGIGVLIALLWSVLQWLFAVNDPRA